VCTSIYDLTLGFSYSTKSMKKWIIRLALVGAFLSQQTLAQNALQDTDLTIDQAVRAEVIDGALRWLNLDYVFPEVAVRMEEAVREHAEMGKYDPITSAREFAEMLTTNLQDVSGDKHVRVVFSIPIPFGAEPTTEPKDSQGSFYSQRNYGFEKVERLAGNVGYLDLRFFSFPGRQVRETAAAAMNFLANVDALIIDLRQNRGGLADTVALISSYLFGPEPVHLNDIYNRFSGETKESWTLPDVAGKRLTDVDVYILTSNVTFSAAEAFAYSLKHLERATIVGEATGGGAHTGGPYRINAHFSVNVPSGRAINPITGTNWEGVGVQPDVEVSADKALATAHLLALEDRVSEMRDPRIRAESVAAVERLREQVREEPD